MAKQGILTFFRSGLILSIISLVLVAFLINFSSNNVVEQSSKKFVPPSLEERIFAIGNLQGCSANEALAYSFSSFIPMNLPGNSDWLSRYPEKGQTFHQFVQNGFETPSPNRNTIFILPLFLNNKQPLPFVSDIASYCEIYFGLKTTILSAVVIASESVSCRHRDQGLQFNASQILERIKIHRFNNCFALLALTQDDIFPDRVQPFSFGLASPNDKVAIISYARLRRASNSLLEPDKDLLRRVLKVATHEIAHLFGLRHCIYFQCLLNGSMDLSELDRTPIALCPICLRKIVYSVGVEPLARYRGLLSFYKNEGLIEEGFCVQRKIQSGN